MWMPSNGQRLLAGQPRRIVSAEHVALDWETIGRAIRECVLDAIEMHEAQSEIDSNHQPKGGIERD